MQREKPQDKFSTLNPIELFKLYFTDDLLNNILKYTNQTNNSKKGFRNFVNLTQHLKLSARIISYEELKIYIGILLVMSVNKLTSTKGNEI